MAKIAGIESTAKTRSVASTMISASASGVSSQVPGRARSTTRSHEDGGPGRLGLARGGRAGADDEVLAVEALGHGEEAAREPHGPGRVRVASSPGSAAS